MGFCSLASYILTIHFEMDTIAVDFDVHTRTCKALPERLAHASVGNNLVTGRIGQAHACAQNIISES